MNKRNCTKNYKGPNALHERSSWESAPPSHFAWLAPATLCLTRPVVTPDGGSQRQLRIATRSDGSSRERRHTIGAGARDKGQKRSVGAASTESGGSNQRSFRANNGSRSD